MIVQMAGRRPKCFLRGAGWVQAGFPETLIGVLIVRGEIQIVLNENRPRECVIPDAVTAHPRI